MISAFVASYGYFAVFVGTLLEGETILLAAGFAAHRGLLEWPLVLLIAVIGGTLGDQIAFLMGRWKGNALIERFPVLAQRKPRIHALLERYDFAFILAIRFLYGLRIAGPVIMGSSNVPLLRFAVLNLIGAILWASIITAAGYTFGAAVEAVLVDVKTIEEIALIVILVSGAGVWFWHRIRAKRLNAALLTNVESK